MNVRIVPAITAGMLAIAALVHSGGLTPAASAQATPKDPGACARCGATPISRASGRVKASNGVPFERPAQFGTRQFLTDAEYAERIEEVRVRDERDLAPVDVLAAKVDAPNAPIPHWREYNTTSRRTSLIIDPPDGRLPGRVPQARPFPVQRCGTSARRAVRRVPRTASASVASCMAAAFPTRCFPPSTTPTCASSRAQVSSRSCTS